MTITISNESASVFARGYTRAENVLLILLDITLIYPKLTRAMGKLSKLTASASRCVFQAACLREKR